jgi:adenosylcobinamide-phosphate synthase
MTEIHLTAVLAVALSPLAWVYQWWSADSAAQVFWAQQIMAGTLAVLVALLLDRMWGEPPVWLHPVVLMGKLLGAFGKWIAPSVYRSRDCKSFVLGIISWCALVALFFVIYALCQWLLPPSQWWWQGLVLGVLLKPLLSWRMLKDEVLAVEAALQQSLPAGRERLSWLVSRDTSQLDAGTVRESAIETLAENLSDSVIAPLFWFALLGLPGAAVYRLANTADAMWGYPGWRGQGAQRRYWQWAGKWAARADDVLNWLPARLTALLMASMARGLPCKALRQDARVTPSPNGGWPMGAMALALGVRLGKPGVYVLNAQGDVPGAAHVAQAVRLAAGVVTMVALLSTALLVAAGVVAYV